MIKRLLTSLAVLLVFGLSSCAAIKSTDAGTKPTQQRTDKESSETNDPSGSTVRRSDSLVVVFSATGTTKGVAEKIARLTGSELKEIVPVEAYSSADLNYNDSNSRTSKEQNDMSARPAIKSDFSIEGYKTIYLGYPIWWGQAPRIMSTFVESHNFTGVTVIPFCTSGSSDIGQSDDTLAALANNGDWLHGRRFSGSVSESVLKTWIEETMPKSNEETSVKKTLRLFINDDEVSVDWERNDSVAVLTELAATNPLTVRMSMYGGFEQVGSIGTSLPRDDKQTTAEAGDILLYSGDQIVVFYGSNSWSYTRLGKISNKSVSEMASLLGNGNVTIKITYEE